jgi:uncharacterized protein YbjQ (UPF0145 family)
MRTCAVCGEELEDQFEGACWKCANKGVELVPDPSGFHESVSGVILSTIPSIPNHKITKCLGVVSGEAIITSNMFSEMLAGVTHSGGRSGVYESKLKHARQIALTEMALEAKEHGGNGVVGINMSYETIREIMLMVAVWGTAVVSTPEHTSENSSADGAPRGQPD